MPGWFITGVLQFKITATLFRSKVLVSKDLIETALKIPQTQYIFKGGHILEVNA